MTVTFHITREKIIAAAAGLEPEQVEAAGREAQLLFTRRRAALY